MLPTVRMVQVEPTMREDEAGVGERIPAPYERRRRTHRGSIYTFTLTLLILLLYLTSSFTHGLHLRSVTLRTSVIGFDRTSSSASVAGAKVGILTLQFDQQPYITRMAVNQSEAHTRTVSMSSSSNVEDLYGLVRLICGHQLFDSHPPASSATTPDGTFTHTSNRHHTHLLPGFLLLTPGELRNSTWLRQWPLLGLIEAESEQFHDEGVKEHSILRGYIVLSSLKDGKWYNRITNDLSKCEVRILDPESQSWLPTGFIHESSSSSSSSSSDHVPFVTRKAISMTHSTSSSSSFAAPLPKPSPLSTDVVRSLLRTIGASKRTTKLDTFLETQTSSGTFVETSTHTQVKFAGILQPILTALLNGLATPMGNMIGEFTTEGVVDPIAEKVLDGVSDSMQEGMTSYVSSDIAVQIVPGICETVTSALTESTARAIAEAVVRGTTETITTDVATRVTHTIVDPVTLRSSQMIAVKLARMLHNSLTHVLSRSIPHIIVPSLLNTVSVGLKEDYYCYFCTTKQMYCIYCYKNRGDTATRLYYALYYTSFHSTYYSNWYGNQPKFGVLMVQKRQLNPLDDVDDEDEKAWDVLGREAADGTQAEPETPAAVITKPELEGGAAEAAEGGDAAADGGEGGGDEAAADGGDDAAAAGGDDAAAADGGEEAAAEEPAAEEATTEEATE